MTTDSSTEPTEIGKILATLTPGSESYDFSGHIGDRGLYIAIVGGWPDSILIDGQLTADELIEMGQWMKSTSNFPSSILNSNAEGSEMDTVRNARDAQTLVGLHAIKYKAAEEEATRKQQQDVLVRHSEILQECLNDITECASRGMDITWVDCKPSAYVEIIRALRERGFTVCEYEDSISIRWDIQDPEIVKAQARNKRIGKYASRIACAICTLGMIAFLIEMWRVIAE